MPARDPLDREVFWFTVVPLASAEDQSDRWAVEQRWISMTPLTLDVTDDSGLQRLRAEHPLDEARASQTSPAVSSPFDAAAVRAEEAAAGGTADSSR